MGGGVDASAGPMSLYRLPGPATRAETPRDLVTRAPSMQLECREGLERPVSTAAALLRQLPSPRTRTFAKDATGQNFLRRSGAPRPPRLPTRPEPNRHPNITPRPRGLSGDEPLPQVAGVERPAVQRWGGK